jgi:hypothetical protein
LLGTAAREAYEELGQVPPFEVKAQLLTRWAVQPAVSCPRLKA